MTEKNIIISISGFRQCGKDTVADIISSMFQKSNIAQVKRYSFLDSIKEVVSVISDIEVDKLSSDSFNNEALKNFGWSKAELATPNWLIETIGSSLRENIGQQVWTKCIERKITNNKVDSGNCVHIISDLAFRSEMDMITRLKKKGFEVYKLLILKKESIPDWVHFMKDYGLSMNDQYVKGIIEKDFGASAYEYDLLSLNPKFDFVFANDGTHEDIHAWVGKKILPLV